MSDLAPSRNFRFSKSERLNSKKKIEELFQYGSSFKSYPFSIKFRVQENSAVHQVLVSVPKKFHKQAVNRNLIKRRIREAYRLNKHILPAPADRSILIGFVYISMDILSFGQIETKLTSVLKRLSKELIGEKRK